jgi:drug/metabolite transporter (DMT)-like permease
MRLPLIAFIGFNFYDEPWDLLILFGGTIIFAGNLLNIYSEHYSFGKKKCTRVVK